MPLLSLKEIQSRSAELNRLNGRIKDTCAKRRPEWRAACEEFHLRFDQLCYPMGSAGLDAVRSGDPVAVENAVRFLEADPYHYRSGYIKEYLWRWLRRVDLSQEKRKRLAAAGLRYLERPPSREFSVMANAMREIAAPEFWARVTNKVAVGGPVGTRALILLAHGASPHSGAVVRRQIRQAWLQKKYGGS